MNEGVKQSNQHPFLSMVSYTYGKMLTRPAYKFWLILLGLPVHILVFFIYLYKRKNDPSLLILKETQEKLEASGYKTQLMQEFENEYRRKQSFFSKKLDQKEMEQHARKWTEKQFHKVVSEKTNEQLEKKGIQSVTFKDTFQSLLQQPLFLLLTFIPGILMYLLIFIYSNSYVKYIFERLVMSLFVIIGVAVFVFTILYISPFNPAANILGETATKEQIANFNRLYGLDQPYLVQLWEAVKGILTFDLGNSFTGNEDVAASIAKKFPVTFSLTIVSLIMAIVIAIPVGIISATKPNSFLDYSFMFIALIGLSIPNFWQGLIFILYFSIKGHWLPATYTPGDILSMIMPVIVLGTALTASVARMTRSSMLEVVNEDYILTARSKGLNYRQVLWKHAIGNAIIPVITVIGLLFGGMLGGAAVTEKVFNISGIGSYIVDKQFIPDIPSVMGGVVYVAITISLVNLIIDVSYAFFDPRIRSKMRQY
ncbi:ABC transporter permease [Lederbergia ruris]|uniref:ABC transporter permease n=2 Tax=Lederbergia ruris TaxID=217495 RepID=A0ABQ4KJL4_9BACI|nr:ABC transporter permease [Lederbergia ruris]